MGDEFAQNLKSIKSPDQELKVLEIFRNQLAPKDVSSDGDIFEQEFLEQSIGFSKSDNPFPKKNPDEVFSEQDKLNVFVNYIFDRRFGWSESDNKTKRKVKEFGTEVKYKNDINDALEEYIQWFLCQKLSDQLLRSFIFCIKNASQKPVVRNQTVIHALDWIKISSDQIEEGHFKPVKDIIILGLTDIWSAVRNSSTSRLSHIIEYFTINQLEEFFTELVEICQNTSSTWQAQEGAVMGMNSVLRRFQWIGLTPDAVIAEQETHTTTKTEYFLRFGREELRNIPPFISSQIKNTIYPLLAHPQLSIRENAIKAYSSYVARCEFKEALGALKDIVLRLCRNCQKEEGSENEILPHLSVRKSEFLFLDPYEAEGLLGVCVFLVKHIPPGFLLPNWPFYFSTFCLYLMHPASTVRQATSTIFKFLVAKDSNNPTILKLVLQGLSSEWPIKMDFLLTEQNMAVNLQTLTQQSEQEKTPSGGLERKPSVKRCNLKGQGRRYNILKIVSSSSDDLCLSDAWEWREGRLLAYELILQFLIKNHWLYTFGPPSFNVPTSPKQQKKLLQLGTSVDEQAFRSSRADGQGQSASSSSVNLHKKLAPTLSDTKGGDFLSQIDEDDSMRGRTNSLTSATRPKEIPHSNKRDSGMPGTKDRGSRLRRARRSICTTTPLYEPARLREFRGSTQGGLRPSALPPKAMASSTASSSLGDSARLYSRMPTISGCSTPSLKTLVRHYSYFEKTSEPLQAPKSSLFNHKAASLLLHTLALEMKQGKSSGNESLSPRLEKEQLKPVSQTLDSDLLKSCLCPSPLGYHVANSEPQWLSEVELPTLHQLLQHMLFQTIESLADERWELRRMSQQLLPCLVEVIRWYDIQLLDNLWNKHLVPTTSLMTYGACLALKYSISHAAKLLPMVQQTPSTWQDPEMCRHVVQHIVKSIENNLNPRLAVIHGLLLRPIYDRITAVAMEIIMLGHCHFSQNVDQKQTHIHSMVCVLEDVFIKAHPDIRLSQEITAQKVLEKSFLTPTEGFLSCCIRPGGMKECAQQVEKCILSEIQDVLVGFLSASPITEIISLMPLLTYCLGCYTHDEKLSKVILDSVHAMVSVCSIHFKEFNEETGGESKDKVRQNCNKTLRELANLMTQKVVDLVMLKQLLDIYTHLSRMSPYSQHLPFILQAMCARINNVTDFQASNQPFTSELEESSDDLELLVNDIPVSPIPDLHEAEMSDEELDPTPEGALAESQTLNVSGNSGNSPSVRLSLSGSGEGRARTVSGGSEDGSDWDSWSEDEDEDQSAVSALFAEFLQKLKIKMNSEQTASSSDELGKEVKKLSSKERKVIENIIQNY